MTTLDWLIALAAWVVMIALFLAVVHGSEVLDKRRHHDRRH